MQQLQLMRPLCTEVRYLRVYSQVYFLFRLRFKSKNFIIFEKEKNNYDAFSLF